jgi:hypothetical protein
MFDVVLGRLTAPAGRQAAAFFGRADTDEVLVRLRNPALGRRRQDWKRVMSRAQARGYFRKLQSQGWTRA